MIKNYVSSSFNKKIIFKNVVVYKNVFNDIKEIFEFIKNTEEYSQKEYIFLPWIDWNANWPGRATFVDKKIDIGLKENISKKELEENIIVKNFYDACHLVVKDYINNNKNNIDFGYDIDNFDDIDNFPFSFSGISFLKYDEPNSKSDFNYDSIAMNYHADAAYEFKESAEHKLLITFTIYLNDNYTGGQISFYNEQEGTVYNYKPKAGDITVFPSAVPFYHGVMPFDGGPRYLCRIFFQYYYDGSDEWNKNKKSFGEKIWHEKEMIKRKEYQKSGGNLLEISYDGVKRTSLKTVFLDKDIIEVD
jgi:hypothetical protein